MRRAVLLLALALLAGPARAAARVGGADDGAEAPGEEADQELDLRAYWRSGLRFESAEREVFLRLGGSIRFDTAFLTASGEIDDTFDTEDGSEFRAARLYVDGEIHGVELRVQYDFGGGDVGFRDAYLGFPGTPAGRVRVGQVKEPVGLEQQTSVNYTPFLERSLPNELAPGRNPGVRVDGQPAGERLLLAGGLFRQAEDSVATDTGEGEVSATGRVSGVPVWRDGGAELVHLGASLSWRNPGEDQVRVRARPELGLAPQLIDSGIVAAENAWLYGVEAAWVHGPFSLQSEYALSEVDAEVGGDATFTSGYVLATCFLTGEHRNYSTDTGGFSRLRPLRPFGGPDGGPGAVELAARWSFLDQEDVPAGDDRLTDWTLGANWYATSELRISANYVLADLEQLSGDFQGFAVRFQITF